jgi:hypothetical protein
VQFAAQRRLVNHPGRFGFVIQRRAIKRHQLPVAAGLAVGHQHMGVQVRIPRAAGFVLVGHGDQTGQPHKVLLPGVRVVHPGVAGVRRQVFHRLGYRGDVCAQDRFLGNQQSMSS